MQEWQKTTARPTNSSKAEEAAKAERKAAKEAAKKAKQKIIS